MNEGNALPIRWSRTTIGGICRILSGYGFPTRLQGKTEGEVPFFKVGDISAAWRSGTFRLVNAQHYLTQAQAKGLRATPLPANTVVFAKIGEAISLNRRAVLNQPSLVDNNCIGIWADSNHVNPRYLFHFACTLRFGEASRASVVPSIRKSDVADVVLPLPPLPEQRRIVAKIEELFSDLDAGVAALERVRANLKRYRAAVLKAAVEGRLTGKDLGAWQPIATAIEGLGQGWSPQCEAGAATSPDNWAVMKTTAVQAMRFDPLENKELPVSLNPRPNLAVATDDVLITRAGPRGRAGVACWVRSTRPRLIVCDKVYRFRCKPGIAIPSFMEVALNAPPIVRALDALKTGISDSGVNLTQGRFLELLIPLPPLDEQAQIVAEVERRLSVVDAVEAEIAHSLQRAGRLRQAILKRAFEGKLVPQDPADEPAEKLLQRIRAQAGSASSSAATKRKPRRTKEQVEA